MMLASRIAREWHVGRTFELGRTRSSGAGPIGRTRKSCSCFTFPFVGIYPLVLTCVAASPEEDRVKFEFSILTPSGNMPFEIESGTSLLFVGANGGGKTRLAVKIEELLGSDAHRISAHRALTLRADVPKVSERAALGSLRTGNESANLNQRINNRWRSQPAVQLLNDYDFLIQALFAEQANTSLESHNNLRAANGKPARETKFEKLVEIWKRILPHRRLNITGDDIFVSLADGSNRYEATNLSDGERAIFYLIGQTLSAKEDSIIIFDEPELHIHRSIMSRLWDELEAERPDCGIIVISHDLEFVASREGQKFVVRDYIPASGWVIEPVPEDSGFSEEVATLILGSRTPVLFVEGQGASLDKAIFRACYKDWTVIPRGSCEEVIHAVITMRANACLTRVTCSGIVDADAYDEIEMQFLKEKGIEVLPVSEIENIFLLPSVAKAIAGSEGFVGSELNAKVYRVFDEFFDHVAHAKNSSQAITRYCLRRIDRELKKLDLSDATDPVELAELYVARTGSLDVTAIASLAGTSISNALAARDISTLLKWYDNKAIMAIACKLKSTTKLHFEQWIVRALRNDSALEVSAAIKAILPKLEAV